MPTDELPIDNDDTGSEEQPSARHASVDEAPAADAGGSTSSQEAPSPASIDGELHPESPEQDSPDTESKGTAVEGGPTETDHGRPASAAELDERLLALERARDAQGNIDTRPSEDETITFRSVTVAQIYIDQAADSLTTALDAIEWVNVDESLLGRIATARRGGDKYVSGNFTLVSEKPEGALYHGGVTDLPAHIVRIYCEYYVLGPSIMAMVLTFVLDTDEAKRIDMALREDAESRLDRFGRRVSIRTVGDVKRERIRGVQDEVIRRCLEWLDSRMPGALPATTDGLRPPIYALLSLAVGKPFDTPAEYMTLLGLRRQPIVMRFIRRDFLFLVYPLYGTAQVTAFNEAAAVGSGWLHDPKGSPELFHAKISSLMIADGLIAALRSFEPRLQSIRADLNRLDIDEPTGTQVIGLRNRLLGLTREIFTASGEVTVFVNDALMVWADFSPLAPLRPDGDSLASLEITADRKRQQLGTVIESLQAQEAELRDLILVTSQSMGETRNLELQTKVLDLTNSLNRLTKWLIVLTIVLVGLGVATLVVQVQDNPTGTSNVAPSSHANSPAASYSPRPSVSPSDSASRTKSSTVQS